MRLRFHALTASLGALLFAACQAASPRPPAPVAPVVVMAPPAPPPVPAASVSAAPEPAPSAAPEAPPAPPPPFQDRTIACGNKLCRVDGEVCCGNGDTARCAPRVVKATADWFTELDPQIQACGGEIPQFCDDSTDCGKGELCCLDYLTSDRSLIHCSKAGSCNYRELCVEERPCSTAKTACVAGECRRKGTRIACGAQVCTGSKPVCCIDDGNGARACAASCPGGRSIACARAADCPPGSNCQASSFGAWCTSAVDIANASVLCDTDAECPSAVCAFSAGKKPRCSRATGQCECH